MTRKERVGPSAVLGGLTLLLVSLYGPLNTARPTMHHLVTVLDRAIPFVPAFVIPYLSYYLYLVVAALLLFAKRRIGRLERYLLATVLCQVIAYVFYSYYQTYVIRPTLTSGDPLTAAVRFVYSADNPYNDFPSLHATLSILAALCLHRQVKYDKILIAWGLLITLSTVFVKQHYVADVAGGALLAVVSYRLAEIVFKGVQRRKDEDQAQI